MKRDEKILLGVGLTLLAAAVSGAVTSSRSSGSKDDKAAGLGTWINRIVQALNESAAGKRWGEVAIDVLEKVAERLLPQPLRFLLHIVYGVEREHLFGKVPKKQKFSIALSRALAH